MTEFTVIAPEGCEDYLTPGKKYDAFDACSAGFYIIDDLGAEISCLFRGCAHIHGQDWRISIPAVMEKVK